MKFAMGLIFLGALVAGAAAPKWQPSGADMVLTAGNLSVKVIPQLGRVSELSWAGKNLLGTQGSLFYPAPQDTYATPWPPPSGFTPDGTVLNFDFYLNQDSTILLAKPALAGTNTVFLPSRQYQFDAASNGLVVTYGIKNTSDTATKKVAPWEVTRVPDTSFLFFPKGEAFTHKMKIMDSMITTQEDSLVWYQGSHTLPKDCKLFRDGKEGWLAQIVDTVLFVKQFTDLAIASFAPGESDIELYNTKGFIEMEQQGPYTTLKPGDSLSWTVNWFVKAVPSNVAKLGNHALVDSARSMLKAVPITATRPRRVSGWAPGERNVVDSRGRLLPASARSLAQGAVGVQTLR